MVSKILHILLGIFILTNLFAQDEFVELEVSPLSVEKNQPITVTIKTNIEGAVEFELPDEFIRYGGVSSGYSSQTDMSQKPYRVISYSFQSVMGYFDKEGEYIIGPIKIHGKNGLVESEKHIVKVYKPVNLISDIPEDNLDEPIFGIIQKSKSEVYEGEAFITSSKVYSKLNIVRIEGYKQSVFNAPAEIINIQLATQVTPKEETIQGRKLLTFQYGKTLIFPETPGNFIVDPFEMVLTHEDASSYFLESTQIKSNETTIRVKPLPDGAPSDFIGGVGDFKIRGSVNNRNIKEGEVFELTLIVTGYGNLQNINDPILNLPRGMVVYGDPEIQDSITYSSKGAVGSKIFVYNIQANKKGQITFPETTIGFFNPTTEKYEQSSTGEFLIEVEKNKDAKVATVDTALVQNSDLRPVAESNTNKSTLQTIGTVPFILSLSLPIILGFGIGFIARRREENVEVIESNSIKKAAKKVAKSRLSEAKQYLEKHETQLYYSEICKTVTEFLASKWNCQPSAITRNKVMEASANNIIEHEQMTKILGIFDTCDQARFGFGGTNMQQQDLLNVTEQLLNDLEKKLK